MKKLVLAVMTGALLWGSPALSQPSLYIGTIEKDRHYDTVEDLLKEVGCHKEWKELASWETKDPKKHNWLRRLFTGKAKPPIGAKIYLPISNYESCRVPPTKAEKATAKRVESEAIQRSTQTPPSTRHRKLSFQRNESSTQLTTLRSTLNLERRKNKELKESLKTEESKSKTLEEELDKATEASASLARRDVFLRFLLVLTGVVIGMVIIGFAWFWSTKPSKPKPDQLKVTASRDPKVGSS